MIPQQPMAPTGDNVPRDGRGQYTPIPTDTYSFQNQSPQVPPPGQNLIADARKRDEAAKGGRFVESTAFASFGALLIIGNAAVIGLETDIPWKQWPFVQNCFLGAFTGELLIKMCSIGPCALFYSHEDASWNFFDLFIVSLGLFDFSMEALSGKKGGGSFATIFRMIRLLRILRIFRVLKFLKQLYVLAFGLVEAGKAIFWVTILMMFVLYVCSIVLVKLVGRPASDDPHKEFLEYRFGHILQSMLTLFILMSSPNLYTYEEEPGLLQANAGLGVFLCLFIIFGSFGIMALLTGVIGESMFQKNELRREELRQEHEEMRTTLGARCEALFLGLQNLDATGEVSVQDVKTLAPDMWKMLDAAGAEIMHDDVERMIDFMDQNGTGKVGVAEFRGTMEKIAEGLSTMAVQEVMHRIGVVEANIEKALETSEVLNRQAQELANGMRMLLDSIGKGSAAQ